MTQNTKFVNRHQAQQFRKALENLRTAAAMPEDDIVRDALVKRLSLACGTAMGALQSMLNESSSAAAPDWYEVLRQAENAGFISDAGSWGQMLRYQSDERLAYDDATAEELVAYVRSNGLACLEQLGRELSRGA